VLERFNVLGDLPPVWANRLDCGGRPCRLGNADEGWSTPLTHTILRSLRSRADRSVLEGVDIATTTSSCVRRILGLRMCASGQIK
jgi:hypothetical protein